MTSNTPIKEEQTTFTDAAKLVHGNNMLNFTEKRNEEQLKSGDIYICPGVEDTRLRKQFSEPMPPVYASKSYCQSFSFGTGCEYWKGKKCTYSQN